MHRAGLLACAKHYPGHGTSGVDSHLGLPIATDLQPFDPCGADFVMTAHALVPAIDPKNCATLSKIWLQRLRETFDGLIITDSLTMEGVLENAADIKQASKQALLAGADILLIGGRKLKGSIQVISTGEILAIHSYLVEAVRAGEIDEERIDDSVHRILQLKERMW